MQLMKMSRPAVEHNSRTCDVMITVTEFTGGGTERYVEDVAIGLTHRRIRVLVVVDGGSLDRVRRLKDFDIPIRMLRTSGAWTTSNYTAALQATINEARPALVHANAWVRQAEIARSASRCRVPVVFTSHATPRIPRLREWLGINRRPFALYREKALFGRGVGVICVSKLALGNWKARIGPGLRAVAVYNGVPATSKLKPNRPPNGLKIMWVGSLIERKRPLLAIRAFARVLGNHPGARLIIVGDGALMTEVRAAAERLPRGSVHIAGFQSSVINVLPEGDIYLQTSVAEGLAYSVLEAMSVGLPVVATDAGATSEAVRHGESGLICKLDDADELASAIAQLLCSAEQRDAYGRNGLQRVRTVFSQDRMMTETLDAYESLCSVKLIGPQ